MTLEAKYKPNQGCNGGTPKPTLQYVIDKGLLSEADYPYAEKVRSKSLLKLNLDKKFFSLKYRHHLVVHHPVKNVNTICRKSYTKYQLIMK